MQFYGRETEIKDLRKERERSHRFARFTVVTGRRRIGKTQLIRQAFDDGLDPYVHLVITKKTERVQCSILQREVERALGIAIRGRCERFADLFEDLMVESSRRPFTLVLDEFQEFDRVDDSVYAEIAAIWDRLHNSSRMNLVVCGSVNRLMNKIFFDDSQPLYGRNTGKLQVDRFEPHVLKNILHDFRPDYVPDDLLALWTVSGGVPRYVELLMEAGATTRDDIIETVFGGVTSFVDEGRTILSDEFGREYGTYFTILAAIASGRTSYAEICNEVGVDAGGYLTRLENLYGLVVKKQPLWETARNKNFHYQIDDCFFRFWFRFVFGYSDLIEIKRLDELRAIVRRDFATFAGYALERYFHWKFVTERRYDRLGAWWDRKGENEIDLVGEDCRKGRIDFYEVKIDKKRIDLRSLERKVEVFFQKNPSLRQRQTRILGLSSEAM